MGRGSLKLYAVVRVAKINPRYQYNIAIFDTERKAKNFIGTDTNLYIQEHTLNKKVF